jgi:hypothetical protein
MVRRAAPGLAAALALLGCGETEPAAPVDLRPDLQLVSVRMDLGARPLPALIAETRNKGAGAAHGIGCRCVWSCPGSLLSTGLQVVTDGVLDSGARAEFSVDAPPERFGCPGPPPALDLTCEVDDRRRIDESNEHNNGWSGPVRLGW